MGEAHGSGAAVGCGGPYGCSRSLGTAHPPPRHTNDRPPHRPDEGDRIMTEQPPLLIGDAGATLDDLVDVARHRRRVALAPGVAERMAPSREWIDGVIDGMTSGEDT